MLTINDCFDVSCWAHPEATALFLGLLARFIGFSFFFFKIKGQS